MIHDTSDDGIDGYGDHDIDVDCDGGGDADDDKDDGDVDSYDDEVLVPQKTKSYL